MPVRLSTFFLCVDFVQAFFNITKGTIEMKVEIKMTSTNLNTTSSNYNWLFSFSYSNFGHSTADGINRFVQRSS